MHASMDLIKHARYDFICLHHMWPTCDASI
jgi:hypothetical protein